MKATSLLFASIAFVGTALGQTPVPARPPVVPPAPQPAAPGAPLAEDAAGPWKVLFDGKTVTGLRGLQKADFLKAGWKIEDGTLVLPKSIDQTGKVTGGDLVTTESFTDFDFSFQWKLTVSGDSGILYLARAGLGQKPTGMEFQIIDDVHHPDGLKGGPIKRTGALYGLIPPNESKQIDDKGWNEGRLIVRGNHVEHWVNGAKVLEYELGSPELMEAAKAAKLRITPGFGFKVKSPIVILDQGEEVAFRNLRIRSLAPASTTTTVPAGRPSVPATPRRVGPTPFKSRIP